MFCPAVTSFNLQTVRESNECVRGVTLLKVRNQNCIFQVILLHVKSDAKEKAQDIQFSIDVDNTLEDILIVLSAEADPSITLLNPTGNV